MHCLTSLRCRTAGGQRQLVGLGGGLGIILYGNRHLTHGSDGLLDVDHRFLGAQVQLFVTARQHIAAVANAVYLA